MVSHSLLVDCNNLCAVIHVFDDQHCHHDALFMLLPRLKSLLDSFVPLMSRGALVLVIVLIIQVPDYLVIGPEAAWQGAGGILSAGYLGNTWEFRRDLSYPERGCSASSDE